MLAQYQPVTSGEDVAREVYQRALRALSESGVSFLVGGAYALAHYTGIHRQTKDLDVFVRPPDLAAALEVLAAAGFDTENLYPHWLAKARRDGYFIDVIHNLANGLGPVDDEWFQFALTREVLAMPVLISAPEEMIWSKSFTMERDRFDGADIAHLLHVCGRDLDWHRLLHRFGQRFWRVLLSHLILFGFIYPGERHRVPLWVMQDLSGRLHQDLISEVVDDRLCQGTLLSHHQYRVDVESWGYQDARLQPWGSMTPEQRAVWQAGLAAGV
jgi:hypothetical protein